MTILYSHQERLYDAIGGSLLRALAHLVVSQASAAFKRIDRAIVTAEPEPHGSDLVQDAAKFPQQPLIPDDKWDF